MAPTDQNASLQINPNLKVSAPDVFAYDVQAQDWTIQTVFLKEPSPVPHCPCALQSPIRLLIDQMMLEFLTRKVCPVEVRIL